MKYSILSLFLMMAVFSYGQSISTISPDNANDGETLDVTISGLNTSFSQATSTAVSFYFNSGTSTVTSPNNVTINNDQSLTANVTVPAGTYQGSYGITVFNTLDGCMTAPQSFLVNGPTAPVLNSISPASMSPGNGYSTQINGTNTNFALAGQNDVYFLFSQATNTLTMATNVNAVDNENLTADIMVPANAYGGDYDVLVYNTIDGYVWLSDGVNVIGPQAPFINGVTPSQGNVGGTYTITISGTNTMFTQGNNNVSFFTSSTNTCNLGGMGPRSNGKYHFPIFESENDIVSATIVPDVINVINDEEMEVTVTFPMNTLSGPVYFDIYNSLQGYVINDFEFVLNDYGLNLPEVEKTFRVYPNPFNDKFTIEMAGWSEEQVHLDITSLSGKKVYQKTTNVTEDHIQIDLSNSFSKGIYILKIVSKEGKTEVRKIIKR